ncbi:hypothetical protein AUC69_07535 [Methyloceanibacter superfactus]|uniref:Uncharacterized protein n=1 Tax=Methyloceanibacter superfactus TaxID=1774969 RepID=A0A1E3W542_9HYPH|nr:hypothetical protein [Methyloceanibacter superfactus]ODS00830.1 hypothetical protein AUC69_07535 [Methyloceanibacter superfactus]
MLREGDQFTGGFFNGRIVVRGVLPVIDQVSRHYIPSETLANCVTLLSKPASRRKRMGPRWNFVARNASGKSETDIHRRFLSNDGLLSAMGFGL